MSCHDEDQSWKVETQKRRRKSEAMTRMLAFHDTAIFISSICSGGLKSRHTSAAHPTPS